MKARPRRSTFSFNSAQQDALKRIEDSVRAGKFAGMLLHGVTGSGKTAVYLAAMRSVLEAGRSAILLVPEIGLTPAVAADLHHVFGDEVAILHSALSDQERAEQWHRIKRGEARMVVGTRSAVFAPVSNLALMIVDEEQDSSYKQEETPRYHARDVAVMRAKMAEAVVVLGSATPSLESYFNAKKNKYALLELPDRVEQRPLPEVEIVDMRLEFQETGKEQVISRKLAEEIKQRLDRKEQVMVLLNRRGYSPVALCRACGNRMECRNCAIAMTHHKRSNRMVCHYCGFMAPVPKVCGECGSEYVYFLGTGSEKLEELLHGMFPQARIGRLDRDTVRGNEDFERALNALNEGELDLLVGTQMIAKGHDIHGVTLVGVVGADMALGFPDFRAAERTFQLLTQVAGRAGRGQTPGKVILQTYFPDHYAVQYAAQHDFVGFYEKELRFRSWMHYPPYSALANVLVRSDKLDEALRWSGILGKWFEKTRHEGIRVLGPAAAPILRLKRDYRYHFVLKSASREKLNATAKIDARLRSAGKDSADAGDCGCGCGLVDVSGRLFLGFTQDLRPGLSPACRGWHFARCVVTLRLLKQQVSPLRLLRCAPVGTTVFVQPICGAPSTHGQGSKSARTGMSALRGLLALCRSDFAGGGRHMRNVSGQECAGPPTLVPMQGLNSFSELTHDLRPGYYLPPLPGLAVCPASIRRSLSAVRIRFRGRSCCSGTAEILFVGSRSPSDSAASG